MHLHSDRTLMYEGLFDYISCPCERDSTLREPEANLPMPYSAFNQAVSMSCSAILLGLLSSLW